MLEFSASVRSLNRKDRFIGMILASPLIIVAITYRDMSLAMQENNLVGPPSYAGFAEIDPNKNFFLSEIHRGRVTGSFGGKRN